MSRHYFTFGCGQKHEGKCQPIEASDAGIARDKMVEIFGVKWSFQYTEEEWDAIKKDTRYPTETELPVIRCKQ